MKVAVDRGGLDVHARARVRLSQRDRARLARAARRRRGAARGRRRARPADARARRASPAALELTGDLDRALDGADFVLVQIRVGGQAARLQDETVPLACGCIGQETTGRRRLRQGAAHGAGRARHRRAGARARSARRVDRRLHQPGRDRHPGAARRRSPRRRAVQRRDRLPAARARALLGVEPERVVVDQVGLNHLTWVRAVRLDERDVLPELLAEHGDELADEVEPAARGCSTSSARSPPTTCATSTPTTRCSREQLDGEPRAVTVARDRARAAGDVPRPGADGEAGAARAARRGVLQRGGDRARRVARSRATARCTWWTCATRARSPGWRTTTSSRSRRASAKDGPTPLPQAPLAPELLGLVQHVAAYERLAVEAAVDARPGHGRARRCSPIR